MNPVVSHHLSLHLRLVGLISAVFVVYIHATTLKYANGIDWHSPMARVQGLLSHNVLHVALPIFFLNASFFLFSGLQGVRSLYGRMRKRIYSLFMPYLAWSAFWLLIVLGLNYLGVSRFGELDLPLLWYLFLEPLPGQLWFLRDLVMLVAFSPLVFFMPFRLLVVLAMCFLCWWLFEHTPTDLSARHEWYEVISNVSVAWFLIGAVAARKSAFTSMLLERGAPGVVLFLLAASWLILPNVTLPGSLAYGLSAVAGTCFLLLSIHLMAPASRQPFLIFLSSYGFLFYLGHHPILGFIEKLIISVAPGSVTLHALVYFLMPLLVMGMIVLVFGTLDRIARPIVFILNGGRPLDSILK